MPPGDFYLPKRNAFFTRVTEQGLASSWMYGNVLLVSVSINFQNLSSLDLYP